MFVLVGRFVGGVLGPGCCRGGLVGSEMIWLFFFFFYIFNFLLWKGRLVRRIGCGGAFKSGVYWMWVTRLDVGVWMAR